DLIKKLEVQPAASVAEAALDLVKRGMNDIAFAKDQIRNVEGLSEEIIARDIEPWHRVLEEVSGDFSTAKNALVGLVQEKVIDLSRPWKRAKYKDLIREKAGADWFEITSAERRQRAHDLGAEIGKDYEDFEITGAVFEK